MMSSELEQILLDFEKAFGCTLTLHVAAEFRSQVSQQLDMHRRASHRVSFPLQCGKEGRAYCIHHCMQQFNDFVMRCHKAVFIKRCRNNYLEVVATSFHEGRQCLDLFAGLWTTLDEDVRGKIRSLYRMLPVFADGLVSRLLKIADSQELASGMAARIRDYVRANYNRQISTRDLARHLSLSVSRTCAVVKEECSATFQQLLMAERLDRARHLLVHEPGVKIYEVAWLCGFSSPEHFCRSFKAYFKTTPKNFMP